MHRQQISDMIDQSPMNRGLVGANWVAEPRNEYYAKDDCVILFDYERPGVYQFHWLASSKGRTAIANAKAALREMLTTGPAQSVYGLVPVDRADVRLMARLIGAKLIGPAWQDGEQFQLFIMTREGAVH